MKKQAFNPYLPSYEYVPDGEPRVFGDRVYVYGSHDRFNGDAFCVNDYVCWSAPVEELGDWRYEGVIYPTNRDPMNPDGKMQLFAPDLVQGPDGRYYLYYSLNGSTVVSVAVCDTPAGDFQFYGYVQRPDGTPYGAREGDVSCFDPGVLVEGNRVYLYTGFAPGPGWLYELLSKSNRRMEGAYCTELEPDMLTVRREPVLVAPSVWNQQGTGFEGHAFFEASSIRKIGNLYYFVYSSILSHELCYAVSKFPDRDFRFGGTLVSIGDIGLNGNQVATNYTGNTHGGMVELGGQWYIFYHRQTNKQCCCRQGCAEAITILPDGSIPQVEITSCGLNGGPLALPDRYEARIACNLGFREESFGYVAVREPDKAHPYFTQSGGDREDHPDQYIANLSHGAWCGFKYFAFSGQERISVTARGDARGSLLVSTEKDGPALSCIPISPSESWQEFTAPLSPLHGKLPLFLTFQGTGAMDLFDLSID